MQPVQPAVAPAPVASSVMLLHPKRMWGEMGHDGMTILGKEGRACLDLEMTHRTDAAARDASFTTILY